MREDKAFRPVYLHGKSNQRYELVAFGFIEESMMPVVIYQSQSTGIVWVRPQNEFFDGRFGLITEKEK
jgi:hypothetical protein